MNHAVNAAKVHRLFEAARLDLLPQVARDVEAMLDDAAIHIDDVQRSVRPRVEVDRAKPFVRRSEKLRFVVRVPGRDGPALLRQNIAPDKIAAGFAQESVAVKFARELIAAIDQWPARSREIGEGEIVTQLAAAVTAIDSRVDPNRPGRLIFYRLNVQARRTAVIRVAAQIIVRRQITAQLLRIGVIKEPAKVILRNAPLPAQRRRLALPVAVGVTKPGPIIGAVNPIIQRPEQAVGIVLDVPDAAGKVIVGDFDFFVRLAVAIGVTTKPQVRHFGNQRPIPDERYCARQHQAILKDRALVHATIPVSVLEDDHVADRLIFARARQVRHEATHLDHPNPAVGIKDDLHRVLHQRFARD